MLCPSCNAPNREDAKFCKGCGQPLRAEQASAVVAPEGTAGNSPVPEANSPAAVATQPSDQQSVAGLTPEEQENIALAPTLILSPDKVLAYRSRFWKMSEEEVKEAAQRKEVSAADTLPSQEPAHIADLPTLTGQSVRDAAVSPLADQPTMTTPATPERENPTDEPLQAFAGSKSELPPPSPFDSTPPDTLEENAEQKEVHQAMTEQPINDADPEASQDEGENGFPLLVVGDTLVGRYEITQVLEEGTGEHIYQVIDRQGYRRCWNCGSEQNREGDDFCIDCGASMLDVLYVLHEYPASSENAAADADVLQGAIVNTFIERGHTYAVEQPSLSQTAFPNGVQILAASNSDAGDVRRSDPNEDSTLVLQLQRVHESVTTQEGIFIVADGLGGHDNGQVASRMTVNIIAERMARELLGKPLQAEREEENVEPADEDDLVGLLRNTIEDANLALCQKNQRDKTDMGSTLTGYMISGEHAYIVNVGDSRTYMVRGGQIYQLTTDHSLVGQLVAGGLIEPDDVYTHPQRSQIFRSLGDKPNVQVDVFKQQLQPGDILLSCSDGLWEMVRNPQLESILNASPDPQTACKKLIEAANANGGEDNVSAVIVFVR
jgi:serine/threonine protein phosphatase PrpC